MPKCPLRAPATVTAWIVLCAFCNCTGWILSALHQLNAVGYAIAFGIGIAALITWRHQIIPERLHPFSLARFRRRFRRFFPLCFLILASLATLGGVLHAPCNYDALAYRVPRMLNWLADEHWSWIHTDFQRLNTRATGIEWLSVPLIAFLRTDRWLFAINVVSYLLLPGLIFSLFRRVGVKPRVAWHWMWLAPSGYCFVLQAGSIANDMFSTVFALASLDYALRARRSCRFSDASLSLIAAALLTGAKASNLPLLLPWLIAFAPVCAQWLARPVLAAGIALCAMGASLVPISALDLHYCGDWTGAKADGIGVGVGPVWVHLLNNGIVYPLSNLTPPVFPFASSWNHAMTRLVPPGLQAKFNQSFEPSAAHLMVDDLQIEESAGFGFGVMLLLIASVLAAAFRHGGGRGPPWGARANPDIWLLCIAVWVSLLYLMAKLGLSGAGRYLAPYYPLLLMGFLRNAGHESLTRQRWWRTAAGIAFALAAMLVVISPARPLWPAKWFCATFRDRLQTSSLGVRALNVYETYGARPYAFEPAVKLLPPAARVVGLVTSDDPETSLWRSFGSRRICHVRVLESGQQVRSRGIRYVLVKEELLREPFDQWLRQMDARLLASLDLKLRASARPGRWHLVELN